MKHLILVLLSVTLSSCVAAPAPAPAKQACLPYPPAPGVPCSDDTELVPTGAGLVCICNDMIHRIRAVDPEAM